MNRKLLGIPLVAIAAIGAWHLADGEHESMPTLSEAPTRSPPSQEAAKDDVDLLLAELGPPSPATRPTYVPNTQLSGWSRPLRELVDGVTPQTMGDPSTAYDLGTAIASCVGTTPDDERIEALLRQGGPAVRVAETQLDKQDYCAGVGKKDFDLALDLLERAAASGLLIAQENYAYTAGAILATEEGYRFDSERIGRYKIHALAHLRQAAASGSATALANLSHLHEQGTVVPADPEAALRYYRAYLRVSGVNSRSSMLQLRALEKSVRALHQGAPGP